jgi:outer membrane biosynthesis protein TonB
MATILITILIIVLFVIAAFSLGAVFVLKRREQDADAAEKLATVTAKMEGQLDGCLKEINELGAVVAQDVDEKHKAVLFLYELIQEKEKDMEKLASAVESKPQPEPEPKPEKKPRKKPAPKPQPVVEEEIEPPTEEPTEELNEELTEAPPEQATEEPHEETPAEPPVFDNPVHAEIWEMKQAGKTVTAIARSLKIGKGEVQMVLDLVEFKKGV